MDDTTRQRLLTEPPGPRRIYVALRAVGSCQERIAEACNCNRAVVSRVVRQGINTTELHARIRESLSQKTGMAESWLFAHVPSHFHAAYENRTGERVMSSDFPGVHHNPCSLPPRSQRPLPGGRPPVRREGAQGPLTD
ncbi:hypothetical protein AAU61_14370 [Desulfocarbo indianensis]|nr:hypothetical protein AAU61_14370 [Desulfocarbo indianensis]